MYYKIRSGRQITIGEATYLAGQIVDLTDFEAAYHSGSIELTTYPQDNDSVFNLDFVWNSGSPFAASIDQPAAVLDVKATTSENPLILEFKYPHSLSTGSKVNIYALSGANTLIDGCYLVTAITSTKISIPLDASAYIFSEIYAEIPSSQSGISYTATVYNPATSTKTITDDSSATTISGSKKVEIAKNITPLIYPGDLLTVEGAVSGAVVQATEPTGLVIATGATATVSGAPWWVTRTVPDYDSIGTTLTTLTASVDTTTARLTLSRAWLSGTANGVYPYRIYSTLSGVSTLLYKGIITVKS